VMYIERVSFFCAIVDNNNRSGRRGR
jgi:hypothetical protein